MAESKKSKKHGRQKNECLAYRNSGTREINKGIRLLKTMDRNPTDKDAAKAYNKLEPAYQKRAEKLLKATGYKGIYTLI